MILPDIMPGILSGFLMAFTMSLDDFVITHFTKGPGLDTLSTKYTRKSKGNQARDVCAVHDYIRLCVDFASFGKQDTERKIGMEENK